MEPSFIHLSLHTEYSIIDGIVRIENLIATCVENNMPAVAITDQGNFFGLVKFYRCALRAGIKPIVGVDIWLENAKDPQKPFALTLLAQNQEGYGNLIKLITLSYVEEQKLSVPVVEQAWLESHSAGLIVLSGAKNGAIGKALLAGDKLGAEELLKKYLAIFPNRFYLELQRTGRVNEEEYLQHALELAEKLQAPVVATNNVRFLARDDFEAHEARVCIHAAYTLADQNRPRNHSDQQYFRSSGEMQRLFADIPEALANSVEIAKRCNVELTLGKIFLPIFTAPTSEPINDYFEKQTKLGLEKRLAALFDTHAPEFVNHHKNYHERLEYEIKVIEQMGFASYFLIVADFIHWAKNNQVPVGPGRGSGAGSLVAYSLEITDLDPISHELLFERFLNPERISMPDFDIDFCMEGRDRVIEYVTNRYGKDRVSQIITYGTMAARAVVRDVGRVLGHPYGFVDKIAKLIPFELGISLDKALQDEELLRKRYETEDEVKTLIDLAKKLEGITRNASKHAGGVVIAPSALTDFMPLYREDSSEGLVSQFDKDDVEAIGLVKFDFLGLRTLTIIKWALETINSRLKKENKPLVDISRIPLDDSLSFKLLQSCNTTAVFQLESRAMKDLIKRLQPDCFDDVVALVALIRPGPMQSGMIDDFIARKHGREKAAILHPKIAPILQPTQGVILYQEQVMQIAQALAGYSLGEADILRRAMGKKKPEEMAKQRAVFLDGAAARGVDKHLANNIFDLMEKFAAYGFNKSHSAAYALLAYQTAWLKAQYPAEYMAAVLSSDMDNTDKVVLFLKDTQNLGIKVLPPDINSSEYQFTVTPSGEISFGLGAIKGAGLAAIENIIIDRKARGVFRSLFDLCKRVDGRKVNRRVLEGLIRSGALDKIAPNRASMLAVLPLAMQAAMQHERTQSSGQIDIFSGLIESDTEPEHLSYPKIPELLENELLSGEKSTLGFYLSGHPINRYALELEKIITAKIAHLSSEQNKIVLIAGFVSAVKIVNTKSGNRLGIVTIEDDSGSIDITIFSDLFTDVRSLLVEDQLIIVEGEVGIDNFTNNQRIRATKVFDLEQMRETYAKALVLKLDTTKISQSEIANINEILQQNKPGKCPVFFALKNSEATVKVALGAKWQVQLKNAFIATLIEKIGAENVQITYSK
ncbi:MAG: DNA polymerase III subunit alpha [Gammaproteobacteria bacterium]|nr:DNA polymerase III subunit alpha [Gammaproteobacteria bacterium]